MCHLSHRQQESEWRSWQEASPKPGIIGGPTGQLTQPMLRRGSAAITHDGLMLLMRESLPPGLTHPQGVATRHRVNLSWQTVGPHTGVRALAHASTHKHTHTPAQTHAHTHIEDAPLKYKHKCSLQEATATPNCMLTNTHRHSVKLLKN